MKKILLFAALITLIGCGGSGSSSRSPFAGNWQGPYTISGSSQVGTANIIVTDNGSVSGEGRNTTLGVNFTLSGSINDAGVTSGLIGGGLSGTINGTLNIGANGRLAGSLLQTIVGGEDLTVNYDLVKQ